MPATVARASAVSRRWSLTASLCLAAAAIAGAAIWLGLATGGDVAEGWLLAARYTARVSFLLFLPVYCASSWHRLRPGPASRAVLANRRSLGLAFASAHTVHLGALSMFRTLSSEPPGAATLIVGGGAYLMMYAMVATSTDAAVRRLGPRRWKRLHTVGIHWLWFVFAFSYAGRVMAAQMSFVPLLLLALGALGLRLVARRSRRSPSRETSASFA